MKKLTPAEFLDGLIKGTSFDPGTTVEGDCVIEDLTITSFPGVTFIGKLSISRCNNLTSISDDLRVNEQLSLNWLPELTVVPDSKAQTLSIWNCVKVHTLPAFEGLELRLADLAITSLENINARSTVRAHDMKRLIKIDNVSTGCLAVSACPELGELGENIVITEELMINNAPHVSELPKIGEGNNLARLFLSNVAVEVIPSNYFDASTKRRDSHVHLENCQVLRFMPAMNVEELSILDCPGVRLVEAGSTIHSQLTLSTWVDCGAGAKLKGKLEVRGVELPGAAFDDSNYITTKRILDESNLEVRRVMTERKGFGDFVKEAGGVIIDEVTEAVYEEIKKTRGGADPIGMKGAKLWKLVQPPIPGGGSGGRRGAQTQDEDVVVVELLNSTPEPDGSIKTYFLRVPPTTTTVLQGVAWTFDKTVEEYAPVLES